jgi:hypothetical protein
MAAASAEVIYAEASYAEALYAEVLHAEALYTEALGRAGHPASKIAMIMFP